MLKRLSMTNPRVNIVRAFAGGDYVFGHTEYDFATRRIGFEVFRFEGDFAVEHWDNIRPRRGPNRSGHSMVDGPTEATDLDLTESNRALARSFVEQVLIDRRFDGLANYIEPEEIIQHNPAMADGIPPLQATLEARSEKSETGFAIHYERTHRVLAEGSFVLCVSEGTREGAHSSFYDLFGISNGKIVEHWDTVEAIPPRSNWKNDNGKF